MFDEITSSMKIGVLKCDSDPLVPTVPSLAKKLSNDGFEVQIESGAGDRSFYSDDQFAASGAKILDRKSTIESSDILLAVSHVSQEDIKLAKKDAVVIGKFTLNGKNLSWLENGHVKAFSLDLLPRTTLAQSMDVRSSLASLAGYKAVIAAAEHFPGYLPMMTTAAGTIPPAKVLILGAGVAGLQAIATARRLGAVVEAFDVRSAVKEEVLSLGAKFVEVEGSTEDRDAGGYAVEQSEEYQNRQKELIHERASRSDIVITTANIPGKKAPVLIEERTVNDMTAGSVIVDMASETGGNCEVTVDGEIIDFNGITVIGNSKLHEQLPKNASSMYAQNIYNFLKFLIKDKEQPISFDHEIVRDTFLGKLEVKDGTGT